MKRPVDGKPTAAFLESGPWTLNGGRGETGGLPGGGGTTAVRWGYGGVAAVFLILMAVFGASARLPRTPPARSRLVSTATCGGELTWRAAQSRYPFLARLPDGGTVIFLLSAVNQHRPCQWEVSFTSRPPDRILATLLGLKVPTAWSNARPSPPRPTPEETQFILGPDFPGAPLSGNALNRPPSGGTEIRYTVLHRGRPAP